MLKDTQFKIIPLINFGAAEHMDQRQGHIG